jgi:hypothetical protein
MRTPIVTTALLLLFALVGGCLSLPPLPPPSSSCTTASDCPSQAPCKQGVCQVSAESHTPDALPTEQPAQEPPGKPDTPKEENQTDGGSLTETKPEPPEPACTIGKTRPCYTGPAKTKDVGTCQAGQQACQAGQTWGTCIGDVLPSTETCDGQDNDCNGQIDDNTAQSGKPCDTGKIGICQSGSFACKEGKLVCVQQMTSTTEICHNNKDDDCDGKTDEYCGMAYDFARVQDKGTALNQRGFANIRRTKTGTYALTLPSGTSCDSRPFFMTTRGIFRRPIAYSCDKQDVLIHLGQPSKKGISSEHTLADGAFDIVSPKAGEGTWGIVNPKRCKYDNKVYKTVCPLITHSGSQGFVEKESMGKYKLHFPECQRSWIPIFTSIYSDKPNGFSGAEKVTSGSHCLMSVYGSNGLSTDNNIFAFWFPVRDKSAHMTVENTYPTPTIHDANEFGDSTAWTVSYKKYTDKSQCRPDYYSSCERYEVQFKGWTPTSAMLLGYRSSPYNLGAVAATQIKMPLISTFIYAEGKVEARRFSILIVR